MADIIPFPSVNANQIQGKNVPVPVTNLYVPQYQTATDSIVWVAMAGGGDVSKSGDLVNGSLAVGAGASSIKDMPSNANTIICAHSANTIIDLAIAEQRIVGRKTGSNIDDLTAAEVRAILDVYFSKNDATVAPGVDNDIDEGYVPGSLWVDVTADKSYICLDNSDGAAVWTEVTQSGGGGASFWTTWNASRGDDNSINSNSANDDLTVGTPIRYKATGGTYRHSIVNAVSARDHTIMGSPCTVFDDDEFEYGDMSRLVSQTIHLAGNFNDADDDTLFASDLLMKEGWRPAIADEYYCVGFYAICNTADGSTDPDVNFVVQGGTNKLFTNDINVNETSSSSADTVANAVNAYYGLTFTSKLECTIDKVGDGDATDMDLVVIFVKV